MPTLLNRPAACLGAALAACLVAATPLASAQAPAAEFPVAAIGLLNEEMPRMDRAVSAGDRAFFADAMGRMLDFSDQWGFKAQANPALAPYAACTEAVSDYLIVGLCRLTPNGSECSADLPVRFDANLRRCRELAARR